ncbi:hypothetical protein BAUCODRAFT_445425 [Baudoinia panamericana UAMH 10762]|uniref:Chromo shadow domain-containing protein n=1 Tax=Baudoinia panamericana (strain UAMH 10762) TaxID=717646 RepID=M2NDH4_BAUPA|nr:uncharacterized protein BAUCODRAFT_445425 [Baudoinia panamericana UAMH 10762]EMC97274.1 hypothetical protein BAUCODRAFT_445425 [Baudoinia panamericana UAMH 10762]
MPVSNTTPNGASLLLAKGSLVHTSRQPSVSPARNRPLSTWVYTYHSASQTNAFPTAMHPAQQTSGASGPRRRLSGESIKRRKGHGQKSERIMRKHNGRLRAHWYVSRVVGSRYIGSPYATLWFVVEWVDGSYTIEPATNLEQSADGAVNAFYTRYPRADGARQTSPRGRRRRGCGY